MEAERANRGVVELAAVDWALAALLLEDLRLNVRFNLIAHAAGE